MLECGPIIRKVTDQRHSTIRTGPAGSDKTGYGALGAIAGDAEGQAARMLRECASSVRCAGFVEGRVARLLSRVTQHRCAPPTSIANGSRRMMAMRMLRGRRQHEPLAAPWHDLGQHHRPTLSALAELGRVTPQLPRIWALAVAGH